MPDAVYSGRVGLQAAHHSGAGPGGPGRRSSAVAVGGDAHGGMRVVWSGMMTSPSCSCLRRTPMPRGAQRWPKHGWKWPARHTSG